MSSPDPATVQLFLEFVRGGPTMLTRHWDGLNHQMEGSAAVCVIESRGPYIAWNADKDTISANVVEMASLVRESDKAWRVEIKTPDDSAFSMRFRRPVSADERILYERVEDACEETASSWRTTLDEALNNAKELTRRPAVNQVFEFSRWLEWSIGEGLRAAGVVMMKQDKTGFNFYPFSGFTDLAQQFTSKFSGWAGDPDDLFGEMQAGLGRYTTVSMPEKIKASDYSDAAERALMRFGKDVYAETGRTVFG
jgi:hypothetical protein